MQITAFNPIIVSPKADELVELFEALGFERAHKKEFTDEEDISAFDLKHPDGFRINIAQVDSMPQDLTAIRMNVRDFDEAYEFLTARGFKNASGDRVVETGTSKATLMLSPSGFGISLSEHIRNSLSDQN